VVAPGLIDPHEHALGRRGERGSSTDTPPSCLYPAHVNRNEKLLREPIDRPGLQRRGSRQNGGRAQFKVPRGAT
jgi:hypothetical protein